LTTAAESIAFNIVEGCGTSSQAELARFLEISRKSSMELEYQLQLARDYGILPQAAWEALNREVIDTRRMLCGLRAKVLASVQ
jgi:four helix bundle protein